MGIDDTRGVCCHGVLIVKLKSVTIINDCLLEKKNFLKKTNNEILKIK